MSNGTIDNQELENERQIAAARQHIETDLAQREKSGDPAVGSSRRLFEKVHPEKHWKYAQTMEHNEVPLAYLIDPTAFEFRQTDFENYGQTIPETEARAMWNERVGRLRSDWLVFKKLYETINIDEQDENTGKDIIIKMKRLIEKYHPLLMEYIETVIKSRGSIPEPSAELTELYDKMLKLCLQYGNLPAYQAYVLLRAYDFPELRHPPNMTRNEWFAAGKPKPK